MGYLDPRPPARDTDAHDWAAATTVLAALGLAALVVSAVVKVMLG